ncbi:hypothetical protein T439DRAFT_329825 [Meredithblackwellia eburnea MCA 4105]
MDGTTGSGGGFPPIGDDGDAIFNDPAFSFLYDHQHQQEQQQQPAQLPMTTDDDLLQWFLSQPPSVPAPFPPQITIPIPIQSDQQLPQQLAPPVPPPSTSSDPSSKEARQRSCAPCRLRRVRCDRNPGETDCVKCKEKGLVCTAMPQAPRKPPTRTGKRIEQARALFGTDASESQQPPSSQSLTVSTTATTKRARTADDVGSGNVFSTQSALELKASSVVGKLVTTELEGALSSSLLDLYCLLPTTRIPLLEGTNFRKVFEASGRRMSQMDEDSEVLFSIILAVGSRVSDHPLLVGGAAPSLSQLAVAAREGKDLSEWGRRRESACAALTNKAVRMADERGIWRKPSATSMVSLIMLEGLMDQEVESIKGLRHYADAYMSHLRELLEGDYPQAGKASLMDSGIGWTAYMRDAAMAASTGRQPLFSDDDVELLTDNPPPPLEVAMAMPEMDLSDPVNARKTPFWTLFGSFMNRLAMTARSYPDGLTGRRAQRNPHINFPFIRNVLVQMDLLSRASHLLEHRALAFLGPPQSSPDALKGVWGFVRVLRLNRCSQALLLLRVVNQRLRARGPVGGDEGLGQRARIFELEVLPAVAGPGLEEEEYWNKLEQLRVEVAKRAFEAAREIISLLKANITSGISYGILTGAQILFSRLPFWLQIVIDTPVTEEGGPVGFTFEDKLDDLRWVLKSLHSIGWSFEKLSRPAPWIEGEIRTLEQRWRMFQMFAPGNDLSVGPSSYGGSTVTTPGAVASSGGSNSTGSAGSPDGISDEEINSILASMTEGLEDIPSELLVAKKEPGGHEIPESDNPVLDMLAGMLG